MKKLLFICIATVLLVSSCKKNNDNSDYYVKMKIDGNWVTWTTVVGELGPDLGDPSKTDLGVTANDDAQKNVFDITIQIDGSNFTTGAYTTDNPNYLMFIIYAKEPGTVNSQAFLVNDKTGLPPSKFTVNILSITDNAIRGNFTGNYLYDDNADEVMNLTEGEFFVRRIR